MLETEAQKTQEIEQEIKKQLNWLMNHDHEQILRTQKSKEERKEWKSDK